MMVVNLLNNMFLDIWFVSTVLKMNLYYTIRYKDKMFESGVKHHEPNKPKHIFDTTYQ